MNTSTLLKPGPAHQTTIPIKILCGCGQKYSFDAEPVNGQINWAVLCPVCGADGTAAANQIISQQFPEQAVPASRDRFNVSPPQPGVRTPPPPSWAAPAATRPSPAAKALPRWLFPVVGTAVALSITAAVCVALAHGQKHRPHDLGFPKDGLPHTPAELNAWYTEPPAGQNAATFYTQGLDLLQLGSLASSSTPILGRGNPPALGVPLPPSVRSAFAAAVQANQESLHLFAQGAQYDRSRYPLDLSRGFDTTFAHLSKIKNAALLLEASATLNAQSKQGKQAADDVLIALGLSRSLESEPALFSQLTRAAIVSVAVAALEQALNRAIIPEGALTDLSKAFDRMGDFDAQGEGFNRAVAAERVNALAALAAPERILQLLPVIGMDLTTERREQITAQLQKPGQLSEEREFLEQSFRQFWTARQAPFPDRFNIDAQLQQREHAADAKKFFVLDLLLPGLGGRTAKEAECLAALRLASTAIALERFRLAHDNRYPSALTELTPDFLRTIPADPFDGQPLRYQKKATGYALYSIGRDMRDNAGERLTGKEGDLVFTVLAPAKSAR